METIVCGDDRKHLVADINKVRNEMTMNNIMAEGTWGTCIWHIDGEGALIIDEGVGKSLTSIDSVPWHEYKESIRSVQFSKSTAMEKNSSLQFMFYGCINLIKIELGGFDTSGVASMRCMFQLCYKLQSVDFGKTFNTSSVSDMSLMFGSCKSVKRLDLSFLSTCNATNMMGMFMNDSSLEYLDFSGFDTSQVLDMSYMFTGCGKLKRLDLSSFNTSKVTDMSSMFWNCTNLMHVNMDFFDTSKVMNMQNMFMYCGNIISLDLSSFNVACTTDTTDMFTSCDKLASLTVGESFRCSQKQSSLYSPLEVSSKGRQQRWTQASTGKKYDLSNISQGMADTYFLTGSTFSLSYEANGATGAMPEATFAYQEGESPNIADNVFMAPEGCIFKEWNTRKNGTGKAYEEGESYANICSDVVLYAIWAAPPFIQNLSPMEPIRYGERLKMDFPKIEDNYGEITSSGIEISPDGHFNWQLYDSDTILTVDFDGYYLRYYAENFVGRTYSNWIKIYIDKGIYDMSGAYWDNDEPLIYDGELKSVKLRGLPEGIHAYYDNNEERNAGAYTAVASFDYDEDNYEPPEDISCTWKIRKGSHDMDKVVWVASDELIHDGKVRRVFIKDLPEGVTVRYEGNEAIDAGTYTARAIFDVTDKGNYNIPQPIDHTWEIRKGIYDISNIKWEYRQDFIYDGEPKIVYLTGLPEGADVVYAGNNKVGAGMYTASAIVGYEHPNYEPPKMCDLKWEIKKAVYDIGDTAWEDNDSFIYDGKEKSVKLKDLPDGLYATYYGNKEICAGKYIASAVLHTKDPNHEAPSIAPYYWQIGKAEYDMSGVAWKSDDELIYDGNIKRVSLKGLPEGVRAIYVDNKAMFIGKYISSVSFDYDEANYEMPIVCDHHWEICESPPPI